MNRTTVEMYETIKPLPDGIDDDVCTMIADWGFKAGRPNLDGIWIADSDGAFFPISDPGCFICWIKGTIEIAADNERLMVIDDSVKMLLLSVIIHKTNDQFPDELWFYSAPALVDWIIKDSGHDDDD